MAGKMKQAERARSSWMRSSVAAASWEEDGPWGSLDALFFLGLGEPCWLECSSSSLPSSMMVSEW